MDDNNLPDDSRQSLYEEFISEIVKAGNPEAYFDEDDLVEIFDYSSDMDNYIAKMEVLLYGARFYPDSQALATRRAWFYSSFGELDAAAELNSRVSNGGVLNELLKLRAGGTEDTPQVRRALTQIVTSTTGFADEDLIQLVDFCAEAELFDWLECNYELIKSKCSYAPTFVYEYANRCEDNGDYAKAVSLFEELTMMEPFTLDFWERQAKAQFSADDYEGAIASADYALAISPSSVEATRIKAMSMFALSRDFDTVIELLEILFKAQIAVDSDLGIYVGSMVHQGRVEEAIESVVDYLADHPLSKVALRLLLSLYPEAADPYIERLQNELAKTQRKCQDAPSFIFAWAAEEYTNGEVVLAARLVRLADKYSKLDEESMALAAEILFQAECYEETIEICRKGWLEKGLNLLSYPQYVYPCVMSLIKMQRKEQALDVTVKAIGHLEEILRSTKILPVRHIPGLSVIEQFMYVKGFYNTLLTLKADMSGPGFDPLNYHPKFIQ